MTTDENGVSTQTFTYDADGRLLEVVTTDGSGVSTRTYTYDAMGRLIDDGNGNMITYDANGNVASTTFLALTYTYACR